MKSAIAFYLDGLVEDGIKPPKPVSRAGYVDVA